MGLVKIKTLSRAGNRVPKGSLVRGRTQPEAPSATNLAGNLNPGGLLALRESVLAGQVDLADPAVIEELVAWFEGCDASSRARAVESLMALALDLSPILTRLLSHPGRQMRLLGISLLEFRRNADVEDRLLAVLDQDMDVCVCAAALDLLCETGTEAALEPLERLKARFASEAYIQFAVTLAVQRIRES